MKKLLYLMPFLVLIIPTLALAYTPDTGASVEVIVSGAGNANANGTYTPFGVIDNTGNGRQGYFNGMWYLAWCGAWELDITNTNSCAGVTEYYWDGGGNDANVVTDTSMWHDISGGAPPPTSVVLQAIGGGGGDGSTDPGGSDIGSTTITYTDNPNADLFYLFLAFWGSSAAILVLLLKATSK